MARTFVKSNIFVLTYINFEIARVWHTA
jgi:hypothetical protein